MIEAHISKEAANSFRQSIGIPSTVTRALAQKSPEERSKSLQNLRKNFAGKLANIAFAGNPDKSRTAESVRNLFFDPQGQKLDHHVLDFMDVLTSRLRQEERRIGFAEKALDNFSKKIPSILEHADTLDIKFLPENAYIGSGQDAHPRYDLNVSNPDKDSFNVYLEFGDEEISLRVKFSPRADESQDYKSIESIRLDPMPDRAGHKFGANTLRGLDKGQEFVQLLIEKRNESLEA